MSDLGKMLVVMGIGLIAIGGLVWLLAKATGGSGVLLPGDVFIRRGNFSFYFPIVTCLLVSAIITLILHILAAFRR